MLQNGVGWTTRRSVRQSAPPAMGWSTGKRLVIMPLGPVVVPVVVPLMPFVPLLPIVPIAPVAPGIAEIDVGPGDIDLVGAGRRRHLAAGHEGLDLLLSAGQALVQGAIVGRRHRGRGSRDADRQRGKKREEVSKHAL